MINESGTMSGGGGKPRGGRMCLGSQAPRAVDASTAAADLEQATRDLAACQKVCVNLCTEVWCRPAQKRAIYGLHELRQLSAQSSACFCSCC